MNQEAWYTPSNLESSYILHSIDLMKADISEYNTSYYKTVEGSEEIIFTHPLHLICYDCTRFRLTHKGTRTKTNIYLTLCASEGDIGEVFYSWYECNCTDLVVSKVMGEPLPLMLIFQGPVPVAENNQWPHIGGFPDFLYSNECRNNDGEMIIKHCHCVFKPWPQTINVSVIR